MPCSFSPTHRHAPQVPPGYPQAVAPGARVPGEQWVPVANDGTYFAPSLASRNGFTIGPKGSTSQVTDYFQALERLTRMPAAYWRRPSATSGTPGIVTAVAWVRLPVHIL